MNFFLLIPDVLGRPSTDTNVDSQRILFGVSVIGSKSLVCFGELKTELKGLLRRSGETS